MDFSHLNNKIKSRMRRAETKAKKLRNLDLFVLDNSLRESTVGQVRGHTLGDKWAILEQVQKCHFNNIIVAAFSKAPRVDDIFVSELCCKYSDLSPYYAFSEIGEGSFNFQFPVGLAKIKKYGLRNVIFEIDITTPNFSAEHTHFLLRKRIEYTRKNIAHDSKILVNIRDFPFAMISNPNHVFALVHYLATNCDIRPSGIMYEEPTGRFSLEALSAWTTAIRKLMKQCSWTDAHLLVHIHEQWGFSNAAQLECLASGADGVWASLCNEGAALGHASSTVSIMNLVRLGNEKVLSRYKCKLLREAAQSVTRYTTGNPPYPLQIIYGERALDKAFDFGGIAGGEIDKGEFDIAEFFGVEPPPRISTLASAAMVKKRLVEFFGEDPAFTDNISEKMKSLMVQDLIENKKEEYMTPMGLALLFCRAADRAYQKRTRTVNRRYYSSLQ